jgi:xanthine/CO dehydrogenase XdhC/CoxF family maturation factor
MVTVADARGSTPRESSSTMLVTATDIVGTIGAASWSTKRPASRARRWRVQASHRRRGSCAFHSPHGSTCGGVASLRSRPSPATPRAGCDDARMPARSTPSLVARVRSGADAGARLMVTADDARGTLDSATLDSMAIAAARRRLAARPGEAKAGSV